jgi:hypothetical protein
MGVRLVNLGDGQTLVAIARNAESLVNGDADEVDEDGGADNVDGADADGADLAADRTAEAAASETAGDGAVEGSADDSDQDG